MEKICTKCKHVKPYSAFYANPRHSDGLQSACKACQHAAKEAWRRKNIDNVRTYQKRWKKDHPENVKEHNRKHYANLTEEGHQKRKVYAQAHRKEAVTRTRQWRLRHPETLKKHRVLYRQRHPELIRRNRRISMRRRRQANPEATHAYERAYYAANRAQFHARQRRYYLANPAKAKEASALRKARKRHAPVVEAVSLAVIYQRDQGICSLCHQPVNRAEASMDHIVPLSKGGEHSYRNIALAHLSCNLAKNNKVVLQQMRLF